MEPTEIILLRLISDAKLLTEISITDFGEYDIGRNETCQITVNVDELSRKHLTLVFNSHGVFVRDNASSNGSFIDGDALPANVLQLLTNNTIVDLASGIIKLEICLNQQQSKPSSDPISAQISDARSRLNVIAGIQTTRHSNQ